MRARRQDAHGLALELSDSLTRQHWSSKCAEIQNTVDPVPDNNDPDPLRPTYGPLYGFDVDGAHGLGRRS